MGFELYNLRYLLINSVTLTGEWANGSEVVDVDPERLGLVYKVLPKEAADRRTLRWIASGQLVCWMLKGTMVDRVREEETHTQRLQHQAAVVLG